MRGEEMNPRECKVGEGIRWDDILFPLFVFERLRRQKGIGMYIGLRRGYICRVTRKERLGAEPAQQSSVPYHYQIIIYAIRAAPERKGQVEREGER
jgi:hypothetical protein